MHSIVVIDDEVDVRDGIKRVLERAGFSVRAVGNVADAMRELRRLPADVVVTDIFMPGLNGVDAVYYILREFPAARIVAISGGGNFDVTDHASAAMTTDTHLAAAKRAGAHLVLNKPFESRELIDAVERVIQSGVP
jgi:CheY-like chemotaxis protein